MGSTKERDRGEKRGQGKDTNEKLGQEKLVLPLKDLWKLQGL